MVTFCKRADRMYSFYNVYFVILVISRLGSEGRIRVLIAPIPFHCLLADFLFRIPIATPVTYRSLTRLINCSCSCTCMFNDLKVTFRVCGGFIGYVPAERREQHWFPQPLDSRRLEAELLGLTSISSYFIRFRFLYKEVL